MPKLEKMSNEELVKISRRMYLGGFFLLPWLWMVNYLYFYRLLKTKEDIDPRVKKYVNNSLIGSILTAIPFIIWFIVFQTQRADWGIVGENLSVVVQRGY